jgi:hypothetical protein
VVVVDIERHFLWGIDVEDPPKLFSRHELCLVVGLLEIDELSVAVCGCFADAERASAFANLLASTLLPCRILPALPFVVLFDDGLFRFVGLHDFLDVDEIFAGGGEVSLDGLEDIDHREPHG